MEYCPRIPPIVLQIEYGRVQYIILDKLKIYPFSTFDRKGQKYWMHSIQVNYIILIVRKTSRIMCNYYTSVSRIMNLGTYYDRTITVMTTGL